MTVRVTREAEPQIEIFGGHTADFLGGSIGTFNSLTFTPTEDSVILVPKNAVLCPQLEAEATPSSYIPTTDSAATRAAETLTIPAENLPTDRGDELVTNGGFDADSDWTKGGGWSISGGRGSFLVDGIGRRGRMACRGNRGGCILWPYRESIGDGSRETFRNGRSTGNRSGTGFRHDGNC